MHLPRETLAFLRLLAGMAVADWLVLLCQHPPQPPCQTGAARLCRGPRVPLTPAERPSPPSRLPFRAEPPMTTTRSLTVCPGLVALCWRSQHW
jgi:hypothetical protein